MNDLKRDPLVANEGGIEAITLIIFLNWKQKSSRKFGMMKHNEDRNNQQLSGNIKSNEGQQMDYFIFLLIYFILNVGKLRQN